MKIWKFLLVGAALIASVAALVGCSGASTPTTPGTTVATVSKGNISVDITAAGNLALSDTQDLPVDLFYPAGTKGTIGEVLVQTGDTVTKGKVLVTIDKSEWDDQLAALEDQVTTQQRNLLQAQINLANAEQSVKNAQDAVTAKETAIISDNLSLQQARDALNGSISALDDQAIIATYNKARTWYDYATTTLATTGITVDEWQLAVQRAKDQLNTAQIAYDNMLSGYNSAEVQTKKQQVAIAERNMEAAESDLLDAQNAVPVAKDSLTLAQGKLQDAQKAVDNAKSNLVDAQSKSPDIVAPFDGFVTAVNVKGGDEVLNGTVAVTIADPNKFEADILVSEINIGQVQVGGRATVTADALPGRVFPATVTHIAPTATIQSGVVNYNVKVEVDNTTNTTLPRTTTPSASGNATTSSELPPQLQQAVNSGRLTEEQAQQFAKQIQSGNFQFGGGFSGQGGVGGGQLPSSVTSQAQNGQLRDGLTVTVTIMVARATGVLVVPNAAVTTQGGKSYVTVINTDGTTEQREVQTGLSDWQNTEITSGLTEGEQVSVPLSTAPSSSGENRGPVFFGGPRG
jgi:HlyD family secretion protein